MSRLSKALLIIAILSFGLISAGDLPDIEDLVHDIYLRDSLQKSDIGDLTVSAISFSRKLSGKDEVKEEKRFIKKYFFKDTLFREEVLEFYLDGKLQDQENLDDQVRKAKKKREKGQMRDASMNPLEPFVLYKQKMHEFALISVEAKNGYDCYHIGVRGKKSDPDILEGDYWFEINGLNPVYAEFHPTKLPGPIKQLDMQMSYAPVNKPSPNGDNATVDQYWLPSRFHLYGRGRVLLFIKFRFEVEETYSNPIFDCNLDESFFMEDEDDAS